MTRTAQLLLATMPIALTGCQCLFVVNDHTNPTLEVRSVSVSEDRAEFTLEIENRSAFDVNLTEIDWEVVYGPLPVGSGTWNIAEGSLPKAVDACVPLPENERGNILTITHSAPFSSAPLDPSATTIELIGTMTFDKEFDGTPFTVSATID